MKHWKIVLDGYPAQESGEVYVQEDGEVIGIWSVDDNDHFSFRPLEAKDHVVFNPFLGPFCDSIFDWHTGRT